jgi:hypothetical protein
MRSFIASAAVECESSRTGLGKRHDLHGGVRHGAEDLQRIENGPPTNVDTKYVFESKIHLDEAAGGDDGG